LAYRQCIENKLCLGWIVAKTPGERMGHDGFFSSKRKACRTKNGGFSMLLKKLWGFLG